jgi:hypothetical protein
MYKLTEMIKKTIRVLCLSKTSEKFPCLVIYSKYQIRVYLFSQVQELDIYQHSRIGYIRSFRQVLKIYRKPKTKELRIADATTVASEIIWT